MLEKKLWNVLNNNIIIHFKFKAVLSDGAFQREEYPGYSPPGDNNYDFLHLFFPMPGGVSFIGTMLRGPTQSKTALDFINNL